ncbi:MAG: hypothetical protein GTN78_15450 [Gemmatimonadales bacterium]|nr:hypothetical protein [Gemmatimonadales bacterium]
MRTFAAAIGGYLEELRKLVEQRTGSPIEVAWTTERLQAEYQAAAALYEAQIEAQRNAAIVARVLSERGDPLGAVPVTVTSLEDPEQEWRVTTDASGEATFAGLGAGEYLIKHGDKPGGERFILDPKERLSAVIGVGPPAS